MQEHADRFAPDRPEGKECPGGDEWPATATKLVRVQVALAGDAAAALASCAWSLPPRPAVGGCFVAFAPAHDPRGSVGGDSTERAWAAAVVWPAVPDQEHRGGVRSRSAGRALRGIRQAGTPRQAHDVLDQVVVAGRVSRSYEPGLLALREAPLLTAAVRSLTTPIDVLVVNATGLDHPRRAGLALHLGAATGVPTVGVTHRPLLASGTLPTPTRGELSALVVDGQIVGYWVCTRSGARPVAAHAGWRTDPKTAAAVVLRASSEGARTPVPLQEARRAAREARAMASGRAPR